MSFNTTTGVGNAQNRGYVTVIATHKVTGMEKNFEVYVKNTRVTLEESKEIKERFAELIDSDYPYLIGYNVNTVEESLDIIFEYDELITAYCNTYRIPKEFVQSVLFRELWCYNVLDDIADASVFAYYEWKRGMMPRQDLVREDCSTGLAQIFAGTAIKALNNAKRRGLIRLEEEYETESWEDMCEVWYGLHYNDEYNLSCCALVILDCQYEFAQKIPADFATMNTNLIQNGGEAFWVITPEEDFGDYDEKQIKMILARYNGVNEDAMQYGAILIRTSSEEKVINLVEELEDAYEIVGYSEQMDREIDSVFWKGDFEKVSDDVFDECADSLYRVYFFTTHEDSNLFDPKGH